MKTQIWLQKLAPILLLWVLLVVIAVLTGCGDPMGKGLAVQAAKPSVSQSELNKCRQQLPTEKVQNTVPKKTIPVCMYMGQNPESPDAKDYQIVHHQPVYDLRRFRKMRENATSQVSSRESVSQADKKDRERRRRASGNVQSSLETVEISFGLQLVYPENWHVIAGEKVDPAKDEKEKKQVTIQNLLRNECLVQLNKRWKKSNVQLKVDIESETRSLYEKRAEDPVRLTLALKDEDHLVFSFWPEAEALNLKDIKKSQGPFCRAFARYMRNLVGLNNAQDRYSVCAFKETLNVIDSEDVERAKRESSESLKKEDERILFCHSSKKAESSKTKTTRVVE